MLETVQRYTDRLEEVEGEFAIAEAAAQQVYNDACEKYGDDHDYAAYSAAGTVLNDTRRTLREVRSAERHVAWLRLRLGSDPVLAYIAANFENNHRDLVDELLPHLPMTAAELRAYGEERNWCGDFYTHLRRLIVNRALEDDLTPARRSLEDWISNDLGNGRIREIMHRVNAAVAELVAEATSQGPAPRDEDEPDAGPAF